MDDPREEKWRLEDGFVGDATSQIASIPLKKSCSSKRPGDVVQLQATIGGGLIYFVQQDYADVSLLGA